MNNINPRNRGAWRAGLLALAAAAVAALATACGGASSSSAATGSAYYQKALSYSHCMRSHGVTGFPDPDAQGNIVQSAGAQDDSNSSAFQAADNTCHPLLSGSGQSDKAAFQLVVQRDLKLAQCMRAHGVPNFPDPQVPSPGSIAWDFGAAQVNIKSAQYQAAQRACQSLVPAGQFPSGN
jgi:hypothetical protein